MKLEVERGTQDGKMQEYTYYLSEKKIHSDRFATDCFVLYFDEAILKAQITLLESQEYEGLEPTKEEYDLQNSHLINKMKNY